MNARCVAMCSMPAMPRWRPPIKNAATTYTGTASHAAACRHVSTEAAPQKAIQVQCSRASSGPCQLSGRDAARTAARMSGAKRYRSASATDPSLHSQASN